jgi:PAS domain S-box-containing protein
MSPAARSRAQAFLRSFLIYLLAVALPLLASWLTDHLPSLHLIPFALYFIAVVVIATLGGLAPMLLSLAVAVFSRNYLDLWTGHTLGLPPFDATRFFVLLAAGFAVALAGRSRLRSQQKLEAALIDLQERTAALVASLNSSRCASWVFDLDSGHTPRWYSGSYPIFGRPFAEIEDMPSLLPLIHNDDHPRLPGLIEHLRESHEPVVFEYRTTWPNGELHWQEMRATRVAGPSCTWQGVTLDITERKLAEAALLRSEKLAAMGRLASTVAHEINNPLESVTNLLYLSRNDPSLSNDTRTYLSMADSELARLGHISRLTLGFARSSAQVTRVELKPTLEDVLSIFRHRCEQKSIDVRFHCDSGLGVKIAPHELRQVFTNLIANAIDALAVPSPILDIGVHAEAPLAVLRIQDNGTGIAPADLSRIFEPFFSTKGETGTGIGLWVTRELVEKAGGHIFAESGTLSTGYSTCFRIEFPLAPAVS